MLERFREAWRKRSRREELYSRPAFWNEKAATHTGTAVSMFINHALNERYQRDQFFLLDKYLGDVAGRRILDVGCGTGRLSRHLARRGATVSAFDFAEKAIDIARADSVGLPIDYRVASVFEVSLDRGYYDGIVAWGCLTIACRTSDEFESVVQRLREALVTGGTLVLQEPFHRGFLHRVLRLSRTEAVAILERNGFEVFATRELHFWPVRLILTAGETPNWLTRLLYPLGEATLRAAPEAFGLGDYKLIAARRLQ